jgi:hypothetical protein
MKERFLLFTVIGLSSIEGAAFRNLSFEEANTNSTEFVDTSTGFRGGAGLVTDLLPGWTAYKGDQVATRIGYDLTTLEVFTLGMSIVTTEYPGAQNDFPFSGTHAFLPLPTGANPITLSQTAVIPDAATWLTFDGTRGILFHRNIEVSVDGETLPDQGSYRFDVSSFAGNEVTLAFHFSENNVSQFIDNIAFDIPEPSSLLLGCVGTVAMIAWSRRRSSAQ